MPEQVAQDPTVEQARNHLIAASSHCYTVIDIDQRNRASDAYQDAVIAATARVMQESAPPLGYVVVAGDDAHSHGTQLFWSSDYANGEAQAKVNAEADRDRLAREVPILTWRVIPVFLHPSVVQESAPEPDAWGLVTKERKVVVVSLGRMPRDPERDATTEEPLYLHPPAATLPPVEQEPTLPVMSPALSRAVDRLTRLAVGTGVGLQTLDHTDVRDLALVLGAVVTNFSSGAALPEQESATPPLTSDDVDALADLGWQMLVTHNRDWTAGEAHGKVRDAFRELMAVRQPAPSSVSAETPMHRPKLGEPFYCGNSFTYEEKEAAIRDCARRIREGNDPNGVWLWMLVGHAITCAQDAELLMEKYWCGCVRLARWERCDAHTGLDHDEEPPRQAADRQPPEEEPTDWRTSELVERAYMAALHTINEQYEKANTTYLLAPGVARGLAEKLNAALAALCDAVAVFSAPVPVERGEETK